MSTTKFIVNVPSPSPKRPHPSSYVTAPQPRTKKRNQVARACDWCRVHRVKCDNDRPCSNCRNREGQCSNNDGAKTTTLPQAFREIDRLTQRVQELEQELERERKAGQTLNTPPSVLPSTPDSRDQLGTVGQNIPRGSYRGQTNAGIWEGIHISTARSPQKTWYGPSSLFYFIGRISTFLTSALKQSHSTQRMLPSSASTLLDGPTTLTEEEQPTRLIGDDDPNRAGEYLSPTQEEYFLSLFWQSYNTTYPILDEEEFKKHYQSLWTDSQKERKPCPLVDIVIAVCMQYGTARVLASRDNASKANTNKTDATIAGRWHYRRCQALLATELESPTISTLQCHLLSSVYLCCASFQNMADNASGLAVRTAYMLGLHLEPPATIPRREKELRKRLWWMVYVLESKMSMKLGRPFLLQESSATCSFPSDDREIAMMSGSNFAPLSENVTWLTWALYCTKLMFAARTAYISFYQSMPDIFTACNNHSTTELLDEWLKGLPEPLKTKRQDNGVAFSTDCSALDIEQFAPFWLQRERLLLELMYHNLSTNLYRPSICCALGGTSTPLADQTSTKCANHAMEFIHIIHQVLTSTSILTGWHEVFQWSWNAAMTLVGFLLAYPQSPHTQAARKSIDLSVAVFETYGSSFAVAVSAATIMRDLIAKVDLIIEQSAQSTREAEKAMTSHGQDELAFMDADLSAAQLTSGLVGFDTNTAEITGLLGQSIDIFSDAYNDFDWSGVNGTFPDQWMFLPQDLVRS